MTGGWVARLGAEDLAVAALVAELGEDEVLVVAGDVQPVGRGDPEEGVVGADRDAQVAGDAAPRLEDVVHAADGTCCPGLGVVAVQGGIVELGDVGSDGSA